MGIRADLGAEGEYDIGGDIATIIISNLLYLDLWLGQVCPIAFPNHCILSVFDLHDEQMISFSWNRSGGTLWHELQPDAVDLTV